MIASLKLKFGESPTTAPVPFDTSPVTVFVGPNNSGKSKVLQEIHLFLQGHEAKKFSILEALSFMNQQPENVQSLIERFTIPPTRSETLTEGTLFFGKRGVRHHLSRNELAKALMAPQEHRRSVCQWFYSFNTLFLGGADRIGLVGDQPGGDLQGSPQTSFQVLVKDAQKRSEIRRIVYEAFGSYFVIDPTSLGQLRVRLAKRPPASELEEIGIHSEAIKFHSEAMLIEHGSDGVKAFVGILTSVIAGDPIALLIDEPEAFLHPSLAMALGNELARASVRENKRVFVSTHSPHFVMGCIQSGAPVNIVRLTYRHQVPTARILPNDEILHWMRNPLLRSTGVLSGLFYEYVVVTEADSDRAFYNEINERLLRVGRGISNCLFLNAQNKQTVKFILGPLRRLGIPAATIVDIDVVKEGGGVWTSFLASALVPEIEQQSLGIHRQAVKERLEATGKNMKRAGGVDLLSGADREAADNLLNRLATYGLFVVRGGELESWLARLNITSSKPNWLVDVFQRMGEDPENPNYVRPENDDVWDFMTRIGDWLRDERRKGIPNA